ncbi:MAG: DUF2294 family protein [Caldilineaceae bacterium]|nr:DUF2294 family protein [Caldilineaceae bacterium]
MVGVSAEQAPVTHALPQIAQTFLTEWSRMRTQPGVSPRASLGPDLLTVELPNALTARERMLAQTDAGRDLVTRVVDHWIDLSYPRLVGQIERLLDCYVTSTGVELEPNEGSVRVQIGLRRTAALML